MKSLTPLLARVRTIATADGVQVLSGAIEEQAKAPVIRVTPFAAHPEEVFLALAKLAEAQLILINEQQLTEIDVEIALGDKSVLARHMGEVHTASLMAFPRGLAPVVALVVSTDWAEEVFGEEALGKDVGVAAGGSVVQLSPAQKAAAERLANDPRFPEHWQDHGVALLMRLVPDASQPGRIVNYAREIYDLEIRPARELQLREQELARNAEVREQARALLESGLAKGKVAAQLGLKNTYALNKVIGEA